MRSEVAKIMVVLDGVSERRESNFLESMLSRKLNYPCFVQVVANHIIAEHQAKRYDYHAIVLPFEGSNELVNDRFIEIVNHTRFFTGSLIHTVDSKQESSDKDGRITVRNNETGGFVTEDLVRAVVRVLNQQVIATVVSSDSQDLDSVAMDEDKALHVSSQKLFSRARSPVAVAENLVKKSRKPSFSRTSTKRSRQDSEDLSPCDLPSSEQEARRAQALAEQQYLYQKHCYAWQEYYFQQHQQSLASHSSHTASTTSTTTSFYYPYPPHTSYYPPAAAPNHHHSAEQAAAHPQHPYPSQQSYSHLYPAAPFPPAQDHRHPGAPQYSTHHGYYAAQQPSVHTQSVYNTHNGSAHHDKHGQNPQHINKRHLAGSYEHHHQRRSDSMTTTEEACSVSSAEDEDHEHRLSCSTLDSTDSAYSEGSTYCGLSLHDCAEMGLDNIDGFVDMLRSIAEDPLPN